MPEASLSLVAVRWWSFASPPSSVRTPHQRLRLGRQADKFPRMSSITTDGIQVTVKPAYWPERSAPESGRFAFLYTVGIANVGTQEAQLRSRHWLITAANGHVSAVRGPVSAGKHPHLAPRARLEYT